MAPRRMEAGAGTFAVASAASMVWFQSITTFGLSAAMAASLPPGAAVAPAIATTTASAPSTSLRFVVFILFGTSAQEWSINLWAA